MIEWIRSTLNPAGYHGFAAARPFFEGWYFKLIDPSEELRYAVIPGIYQSPHPEKSHAFIQVLNGKTGQVIYHPYPAADFHAERRGFSVRIGPNHFSRNFIKLNIPDAECPIQGELYFRDPAPTGWPVRLLSPGIMGWYAWVPFMQCYHGVVSLDHGLHGQLRFAGQPYDFTGGRGYIEKDWGQSFPSAWVWFQSNHFTQPGTCLTASIAVIPWLWREFPGFIVGLWHANRLYTFATYTGARTVLLSMDEERVHWVVRDHRLTLEMVAARAAGGILRAPVPSGMDRRIAETLDARVSVRLTEGTGREARLIFEDEGRNAGLEAVGDVSRLQR